jgi:hypothetical protein
MPRSCTSLPTACCMLIEVNGGSINSYLIMPFIISNPFADWNIKCDLMKLSEKIRKFSA